MRQLQKRRRKPRDVLESLILDMAEGMEEVFQVRGLNVEEAQTLIHMYKALSEARVHDAESDAIGALTIAELNKMDELAIEVRDIDVEGSDRPAHDAAALPGVAGQCGEPPAGDPPATLAEGKPAASDP